MVDTTQLVSLVKVGDLIVSGRYFRESKYYAKNPGFKVCVIQTLLDWLIQFKSYFWKICQKNMSID